jgi:RimJ/RimL family protein N-acetyltransferase
MFCKPFRGSIHWTAERGTGIASEATSKMTDYVFAETEIVRIAALVYSPNTASMKVLEKCGYRLEAIRQKAGFKHGVFLDEHAFVKFRP